MNKHLIALLSGTSTAAPASKKSSKKTAAKKAATKKAATKKTAAPGRKKR